LSLAQRKRVALTALRSSSARIRRRIPRLRPGPAIAQELAWLPRAAARKDDDVESSDQLLVLAALAEQGFYRSGERLMAPNGTVWLSKPMLELCGVDGLRTEARQRLSRKLRQRRSYESSYDWQCAVEDVQSLLGALDQVHQAREPEPLAEAC
jgi:hypothetical protein